MPLYTSRALKYRTSVTVATSGVIKVLRVHSMANALRRTQPPWCKPVSQAQAQEPKLSIVNSLTRSKTPFVPIDIQGKNVTWYACGPTVYDDAHLGHARNYVSTDIIRRILVDYFDYDVKFVMNITDVDDKIIVKAREEKLLDDFKRSKAPPHIFQEADEAFLKYLHKKLPILQYQPGTFPDDAQKYYETHLASLKAASKTPGDNEAKMKRDIKILVNAHTALKAQRTSGVIDDEFWLATQDILKPFLDGRLGHTFDQDDHTPFNAISRKYEARFFEDMDQLNVRRPDVVTRVTEYGEAIVEYVERVIENGFAYVIEGSVYFDIDAFERAQLPYARLEPWNRGNKELQADGEGALSKGGQKKSSADFALWKASKPGEPAWPSPWGKGRPGWHIECSAMASKELGATIDIHSGGIDLAFPHHDNELAQSEAYWHPEKEHKHDYEAQWINYFMHMGHLHIGGAKMSKSLKNFTTIREDLKSRNARTVRLLFLMGNWNQPMEVTEDMLKETTNWEKNLNNFFLKAKDTERRVMVKASEALSASEHENSAETTKLHSASDRAQEETHKALSDSFDTPRVMQVISELVSQYNSSKKATLSAQPVLDIARWITRIIMIFGLDSGKHVEESTAGIGWSGLDIPEDVREDIYKIADFRDELRIRANRALKERKAGKQNGTQTQAQIGSEDSSTKTLLSSEELAALVQPLKNVRTSDSASGLSLKQVISNFESIASSAGSTEDYLALCDRIRDEWLWNLGVYLEDSMEEGQPAIVRPLDAELVEARKEVDSRKKQKAEQDRRKQEEKARKDAEADAKARQDPTEMFKTGDRIAEFSAWDDNGIPTKLADGSDLTKNKSKGLKKEWDAQKKRHEQWKSRQGSKG